MLVHVEPYPFGRRFALTFVDDTDSAVLPVIEPVYDCLRDHGLRTTKTVWAFEASALSGGHALTRGETLQSDRYREFCVRLQAAGFEIALHTATGGDSPRAETFRAYDYFEQVFNVPPVTNIMHGRNRENIYWGKHSTRYPLVAALIGMVEPLDFAGHQPGSEWYWGDLCRERTRYVRLFETLKFDTLAFDPATPYHDPRKPDVPWWFSATYAHRRRLFRILTASRIERLAARRSASILHVYFRSFAEGDERGGYTVQPGLLACVRLLADRDDGWYVPVATLLDRIRAVRGLRIAADGREIVLRNEGTLTVEDAALALPAGLVLRPAEAGAGPLARNGYDQVPVGTLQPGAERRLVADRSVAVRGIPTPEPNEPRLLLGQVGRMAWQFFHGRRRLVHGWKKRRPAEAKPA